jgi:hypothetical protein
MRSLCLLTLIFFSCLGPLLAQTAIGQWTAYTSFRTVKSVTKSGDKIYAISDKGMFSYIESRGQVERYSKVNGLSDIGLSSLAADEDGRVMVGYSNGNLDIIEGEQTINISDIKRSSIIGDKTIYSIKIKNGIAWLACGFGIVLIDIEQQEVRDTYLIGDAGAFIQVNDILITPSLVYASTVEGIRTADPMSNLADFSVWSVMTEGLLEPLKEYGDLVASTDKIYTFTRGATNAVFIYDGVTWGEVQGTDDANPQSLSINSERLLITNRNYLQYRSLDGTFESNSQGLNYDSFPLINEGYIDESGRIYLADEEYGIVIGQGTDWETFYPQSPWTDNTRRADANNGDLWLAHGRLFSNFDNTFSREGTSGLTESGWIQSSLELDVLDIRDIVDIMIDPVNPDKIHSASFLKGLVTYSKSADSYTLSNSSTDLNSLEPSSLLEDRIQAGSIAADISGNVWVTNSYTSLGWKVRSPQGEWTALGCPGVLGPTTLYGDMAITEQGQTWTILPRGNGIAMIEHNNDLENTGAHRCKRFNTNPGDGALPTNSVLSIAVDLDGEIWAGTAEGPVVNYSPTAVFGDNPVDFQSILVERDGNVERLLGSESITAIAIDGANRKWLGTLNGGVFLLSENGTEEILHFTADNSPLLADAIQDITIDAIDGTVFFVTGGGVVGYKSDANGGVLENECYDVYPNPVRPDYRGPITLDGLMGESEVKITDLSGNIVFQTISNGGRAIWQGTNLSGQRVSSGVYFALVADPDGESTCISKILFIN